MVELVRQPGTTAASVARDLDLTETAAQPSHRPHAPRAACRELPRSSMPRESKRMDE